jgi:hypothetical protein
MKKLEQRRKEVRALRASLSENLHSLRDVFNPFEIVENILVMIDPELRFLARLQSGIRRNPLLAAGLLAGASWLVSNGSDSENGSLRQRHPKKTSTVTNHRKGEYDDTQQQPHHSDQRPELIGEEQDRPQL